MALSGLQRHCGFGLFLAAAVSGVLDPLVEDPAHRLDAATLGWIGGEIADLVGVGLGVVELDFGLPLSHEQRLNKIGRASCRERV